MGEQPSVEERLFMPRRIANISHPRRSEGLFVHKDVCTAVQQFLPCVLPNDWHYTNEASMHSNLFQTKLRILKLTFIPALLTGQKYVLALLLLFMQLHNHDKKLCKSIAYMFACSCSPLKLIKDILFVYVYWLKFGNSR